MCYLYFSWTSTPRFCATPHLFPAVRLSWSPKTERLQFQLRRSCPVLFDSAKMNSVVLRSFHTAKCENILSTSFPMEQDNDPR